MNPLIHSIPGQRMKRSSFLGRFIGSIFVSTVLLTSVFAAAQPRPNIVFILLDNVGQEWFGCYGSEEHATPNIDRLAQGGVRFTNCYTTTVCGPSRVQFL